ncbi:uncharacterized protein L969DRAFT_92158 [Mixia osmundae IAM 14324]|uniref:Ribosomal L1 domain-containing protein 1 n=1 Tax=Mixia osmundae (strain CBS 9802 / IAM 14324 / JCM 22182 / KY 12970) TaxID=764103 RepID=G7DT58_MIXOS|nr:uncharacterized protein L969DRAFT_92158 [Mixia osmundae IAM 14324]KEI42729.1 hypothetical protein L969DRAFT_92158 [Mixia osmundae IAM 14324]GAA93937.1 hypothetical protein E5Q_00583 [Mixia osmundae IAM 14324]
MGRTNKDRNQKLFTPAKLVPLPPVNPPALSELPIDQEQCRKALDALLAFHARKRQSGGSSDLLETEEILSLVISLKKMTPRDRHMPVRIPLAAPLLDPRQSPVCLLVKDPQREYKDMLEEKNITFISRVVGVEKLKGKFKPFEARRQLMREYDLFLADDRIVPMLPKLLGRNWLEAKKQPIPVTLSRTQLKAELERALSSTYLYLNRGNCLSVKVGGIQTHTPDQLFANILAIVPHLAVRLPEGGWDNIQALHLKTTTSASLPIWTSSLADDETSTSRFGGAALPGPPKPLKGKALVAEKVAAAVAKRRAEAKAATDAASPVAAAKAAKKASKAKSSISANAGEIKKTGKRVKA